MAVEIRFDQIRYETLAQIYARDDAVGWRACPMKRHSRRLTVSRRERASKPSSIPSCARSGTLMPPSARPVERRGPLELDLPERKVEIAEDGTVAGIRTKARFDAHKLIEELMIQANVCAAEELEKRGSPLLYRVHDAPSDAKDRGPFRVSEDARH